MSLVNKRCVFTVTTGRSGSGFLAETTACLPRVLSLHEPKPKYDRVLNMVQMCPQVAREFLLKKKLPAIEKAIGNKEVYIETSHLFCKGFLEAWLDIKDLPTPDLICLDRDFRKTALSLFRLNIIPGRNWEGVKYLSYPDSKTLMTRLNGHENMSDYQLCYWYCLEIDQRKKAYKTLIESKGGRCIHTSIDKLRSEAGFEEFRKALDFPELSAIGRRKLRKIQNRVINAKSDSKKRPIPNIRALGKMEDGVRMSTEIAGIKLDAEALQVNECSQVVDNNFRSLALGLAQLNAIATKN